MTPDPTKENCHHLRRWKNRPYWLRMRIDQGPKYVGKDVYVGLGTTDLEDAKKIRDCLLRALAAGEFICSRTALITPIEAAGLFVIKEPPITEAQ